MMRLSKPIKHMISYKEKTKNDLSQVENDFIKQLETETKQLKNKK
jgi:hypothetical protein